MTASFLTVVMLVSLIPGFMLAVSANCVSMATISAPTVFALGELPETITNSFYLAEETDETGGRTLSQFESGDVCNERGKHFNAVGACVICGESVTHTLEFDMGENITASYTVNSGDSVLDLSAVIYVKSDKGYGYEISELGGILTANGNTFRLPFDGDDSVFGVRVISPAFEVGEGYSMKAYISGDFEEVQSGDKDFSFTE